MRLDEIKAVMREAMDRARMLKLRALHGTPHDCPICQGTGTIRVRSEDDA